MKKSKLNAEMPKTNCTPYTPHAKTVAEFAAQEARRMGHSYIGTEHLLLGLIRANGVAARILKDKGVSLEAARIGVLYLMGGKLTAL